MFVFIGWSSMKEEESSTILRMMIIKRFQKDIKNFSTNKIIKRNLTYILDSKKNKTLVLCKQFNEIANINEKDAYNMLQHPFVFNELEDGSIAMSNLTSSKYVEGKATIPVGLQKNGKISYIVDKFNVVESKKSKEFKKFINEDNFSDKYNKDVHLGEQVSINVANKIENVTNKHVKNNNLESIKTINLKEPVDKL